MKLDDVFFAIGIIIISSLLVFVIYDDTVGNRCQEYMDEYMNNNSYEKINLTEKDIDLIQNNNVNSTNNTILNLKIKSQDSQSSNSATITKVSKTNNNNPIQTSNSQKNNDKNNVKTYSKDSNPSSFSNTRTNKEMRQNTPVKKTERITY